MRTSVSGTSTMYSLFSLNEYGEKKERMYIRSLFRESIHLSSDAMLHGRLFERSAKVLFKCIYKMTILKSSAIALAHSLVHHSLFDVRILLWGWKWSSALSIIHYSVFQSHALDVGCSVRFAKADIVAHEFRNNIGQGGRRGTPPPRI